MKEKDYSKNWKTSIRLRHKLAKWGFSHLKPPEPDEDYYLYGKYQIPPEKIPPHWINHMDEEKEHKLRYQAYQEACEQYKRDGYWKDRVRVSIAEEIEIYKNLCKYVDSHPFDKKERRNKIAGAIVYIGVIFTILYALIGFSIILYKVLF